MCGVAGIVNFDQKPVEKSDLVTMTSCMQERGPDHTGYWLDRNIGLGHTRLSIIDLDSRADQPMLLEEQLLSIVFNGEIYNFPEIKASLKETGVEFHTTSDTEVLLHGYSCWGMKGLLAKIRGMFAFAIIDRKKNRFFLARDHFGKKPLYYSANQGHFVFCSDIRGIQNVCSGDLTLDLESIDYFLTEFSVPQPKSIWEEVQQLPAAHWLECPLDSYQPVISEYWNITSNHEKSQLSDQEIIEVTESKLRKAISRRTLSDVPIACFLSGGVDSGLITSLLAQEQSSPINTYSVGFSFEEEDELPDAAIVAERYDTNHHELILQPDILEDLPKIVEYLGEPFADPSCVPSYYITKAIGSEFKVALSGDGGDELFGGYTDYTLAFRSEQFALENTNAGIRKGKVLVDKLMSRFQRGRENMGSYETYLGMMGGQRLTRKMGFDRVSKKLLLNSESYLSNYTESYLDDIWTKNESSSITDSLLKSSLKTRLLNDYLVKVDRVSMMNSLEVRSPFLDVSLAEWAFNLPNDIKFKNNHSKYILKKIAEKHVRPDVLKMKKKGFGLPLGKWLQNEMHDWMKSILLDSSSLSRQLLNESYVSKLIDENKSTGLYDNHLWALICLSLWGSKFY